MSDASNHQIATAADIRSAANIYADVLFSRCHDAGRPVPDHERAMLARLAALATIMESGAWGAICSGAAEPPSSRSLP